MICSSPFTPANQTTEPVATSGTYRYAIFRSIEAAARDWDAAAPVHDLFLQRPYLLTLENNPPQGMRFAYLVFYKNEDPIGVAICQIKYFKGDDSLNELDQPAKEPCFFSGLGKWFKRWVAGKVAADILICGNMLVTGEHGYWFDGNKISAEKSAELLETSLVETIRFMEREGVKMPVILVKDLAPENTVHRQAFIQKAFLEFEIQPNMVLDLPFNSFEEYLDAMSTKYRTRAKRAFKKGAGIVKKELTLPEIQRELPRIYALYKGVANNAGFNMVDLNEHYLAALKRDLPEDFRLFAYYVDGELVTFFTTIKNHAALDAHYLGYDKSLNHDLQLYLNALYDIVRIGIESDCSSVVFARTALEIKSSVGAEPANLYCSLRHQNGLANRFTGALLEYLKPVEKWQQRHPFKHGLEESLAPQF